MKKWLKSVYIYGSYRKQGYHFVGPLCIQCFGVHFHGEAGLASCPLELIVNLQSIHPYPCIVMMQAKTSCPQGTGLYPTHLY